MTVCVQCTLMVAPSQQELHQSQMAVLALRGNPDEPRGGLDPTVQRAFFRGRIAEPTQDAADGVAVLLPGARQPHRGWFVARVVHLNALARSLRYNSAALMVGVWSMPGRVAFVELSRH